MKKKTAKNTDSIRQELPQMLGEIGVGKEFLDNDVKTKTRLKEIIENLPDNLVTNLHERISHQMASLEINFRKYLGERGISKSEEKLLASLMQGNTVVEHAENFGISVNTARTHMRALLDKTQSKGQLDLVQKIHNLKE